MKMRLQIIKFKIAGVVLATCVLLSNSVHAQSLKGAGAASTYPLLSKWFDTYQKQQGIRIEYQSIGVGGGLYQLKHGDADFAVTDSPLEKRDTLAFAIQQAPIADENVAIIYNLTGLKRPLKISGSAFGAIMRGQITRWDDARLKKLNPENVLPATSIIVVKRDNRSGVNWATTRYLNQTDKSWNISATPNWQFGIGSKGCDITSALVKKTPNSIGFVELSYARQNKIACAEIGSNGKFYSPDSPNYPVTTRHYLIWKKQSPKSKAMDNFAKWVLTDGQKLNAPLFFKPIPTSIVQPRPLKGAGSETTSPLLTKWFATYKKQHGVQMTYEPFGMGAGIRDFRQGKTDFLVSASPIEKKPAFAIPFEVQQAPLADENVAIIYNLPGIKQPLKMNNSVVNAIMRGKITRWNDARLQKLNPDVILPNAGIGIVTHVIPNPANWAMTRYLHENDKSWKVTVFARWAVGFTPRGGDSIAATVKNNPNRLGFIAFQHAKHYGLQYAEIENGGKFYSPSSAKYPIWTRHFLVWKTKSKNAKQVAKFAKWILTDGHRYSGEKIFSPLPAELRQKALAALD